MRITKKGSEHIVRDPNCQGCSAVGDGRHWPQLHRSAGLLHPANCDGYMHCEKAFDSKGNDTGLKCKCDTCGRSDYRLSPNRSQERRGIPLSEGLVQSP